MIWSFCRLGSRLLHEKDGEDDDADAGVVVVKDGGDDVVAVG